jgi:hypothetical protein
LHAVVACTAPEGLLSGMNTNGNPGTLVASHPGNTNAVKHGVHSASFIQPRAAEVAVHLNESFDFTDAQRVDVEQAARCIAIIEAIDRDLDERGLVGKRGEVRSILAYRSRISRELERWLAKLAPTMERQSGDLPDVGRDAYVTELQLIATGQDSTASARDRIFAIKELLTLEGSPSTEAKTVHVIVRRDDEGNETVEYADAGN